MTEVKRQLVKEMISTIRRQFVRLLEDHAYSLSREAKRRTLEKILELQVWIGGPEDVYDQFKFAENLGLYGVKLRFVCEQRF